MCNRYRGLGQRSFVRFVHLRMVCSLTCGLVSSLSSVGAQCIGRTAKRSSETGTYVYKNEGTTRTLTSLTIEKQVQLRLRLLVLLTLFRLQHYQFGTSEYINKNGFKVRIQNLISELSKAGPLYLVFHDYSQDIK